MIVKLQEKIYYCRKKAGLSQEALAERLGVSRQAVSKWETGDAVPELGKLSLLAKTFGVSADWLLSEEEQGEPAEEPSAAGGQDALERLPGLLGRLFRRYGWLGGLYLAAVGAAMFAMGALARYMVRKMFSGFGSSGGSAAAHFDRFLSNNPVSMMGMFMMLLGIVLLLAGIILAIVLKRRSRK